LTDSHTKIHSSNGGDTWDDHRSSKHNILAQCRRAVAQMWTRTTLVFSTVPVTTIWRTTKRNKHS